MSTLHFRRKCKWNANEEIKKSLAGWLLRKIVRGQARKIHFYYAQMRACSLMQSDDGNDWNIVAPKEWTFAVQLLVGGSHFFLILCGFVLCAILHGGNWKFITLKRSAHVFCPLLWEWEDERTKLQKKKNNSNHNSTQLQRQEEGKEEETDRAEEMKKKN